MTVTVTTNIRGLEGLRKLAANPQPMLVAVGALLEGTTTERFKTETAPSGQHWQKTKGFGNGKKTLTNTERLRRSIVSRADKRRVLVGTNVVYAAAHQFGTKPYIIRPKNKRALFFAGAKHPLHKVHHPGLVARRFLGVSAQDRKAVIALAHKHLARAIG